MSIIKTKMPLIARHEGEWSGSYTVIDTEGKILDKYTSYVSCQGWGYYFGFMQEV
ncbi:hypothetical protein [Nostoc sp. ChiQUE01b]|uniref:hypothetical protein n=1 Tax=Nostoc sp. ChiQUE01b TaxID=3075376 RepID=UPI002AD58664|nr:hypothetical protein [Nostoc sp. ChiQUE01b]MDZ8258430.1 hypothetical protein [Nostoc sp. ChiQUE01b]